MYKMLVCMIPKYMEEIPKYMVQFLFCLFFSPFATSSFFMCHIKSTFSRPTTPHNQYLMDGQTLMAIVSSYEVFKSV